MLKVRITPPNTYISSPPEHSPPTHTWSCKCKFFGVYRPYKDRFLKK